MKGNFHVRFLEGGGLATARLHSISPAPHDPPPISVHFVIFVPLFSSRFIKILWRMFPSAYACTLESRTLMNHFRVNRAVPVPCGPEGQQASTATERSVAHGPRLGFERFPQPL